jgi:TPP-dependent indolepyruvate ferredoxin oxidoreductase alpha subunit
MLLKLTNWFHELFKSNTEERKTDMLNLVLPFVANMLRDVVADKAQSLAVEHLEPHLEKLPKEVREALDGAVDGDNSHGHKSLLDLIKG